MLTIFIWDWSAFNPAAGNLDKSFAILAICNWLWPAWAQDGLAVPRRREGHGPRLENPNPPAGASVAHGRARADGVRRGKLRRFSPQSMMIFFVRFGGSIR